MPTLRYICILDFEATCERPGANSTWDRNKQEIIEFPVLLYNVQTREIERVFHEYVRPVLQPQLTEFCTELTGIEQETVDKAEPFNPVWQRFTAFVAENLPEDSAFLTCGNWDLKTMLPLQLAHATEIARGKPPSHPDSGSFEVPPHMRHWLNIKRYFTPLYPGGMEGMAGMLKRLGLPLEGRHHSGIDDCKNISRIVTRMLEDGWKPVNPAERYLEGRIPENKNVAATL